MKKISMFSMILVLFLAGCQDPQLIPPRLRFYEVQGYQKLGFNACIKKEIKSRYIYAYDVSDSVMNIMIQANGPSDNQPFLGHVEYTLKKPDGTSIYLNSLNALTDEQAPIHFQIIRQTNGEGKQEQFALLTLSLSDNEPGDTYELTASYLWYRPVTRSLEIIVVPENIDPGI